MKVIIVLLALAGFVQSLPTYDEVLEAEWMFYKSKYEKSYVGIQEQSSLQAFKHNKEMIEQHNARYKAGEETFIMGVNEFSDLQTEEFETLMFSGIIEINSTDNLDYIFTGSPNVTIPTTVDWRKKKAVTKVKRQGHCGSCWAFSATGAVESHHFIKTKKLVSLSEQQLVDCASVKPFNLNGCRGGWPSRALKYIKSVGGIDTATSYPYKARNGTCRFKKNKIGAKVESFVTVKKNSEKALAEAVATKGPISVVIRGTKALHQYKTGVITKPCKKDDNRYHAVLLVGYGTDKKHGDYWLLKNSWGRKFGENGYFRMARNKKNICKIAENGVYPVISFKKKINIF